MKESLKRISQRDWPHGDCGLACVAMTARTRYEDALDAFRKLDGKARTKSFYTNHRHIEKMLFSLGYTTKRFRFQSWRAIEHNAIVKVNPNKSGNWHWVVFDADRAYPAVHHPKPGKRKIICDFRGLKGNGYYIAVVARRTTALKMMPLRDAS